MNSRISEEQLRLELGKRLETAIRNAGKKQYQVADAAKIDRGSFNKFIHGERRPSIEQLSAIAGVLNLKAADFLDERTTAEPTSQAVPPEHPLAPGLAEYLKKWEDRLPPAVVRHLRLSHFSTDAGVIFDEEFWHEQAGIWNKRLGFPSSGKGGSEPEKKG